MPPGTTDNENPVCSTLFLRLQSNARTALERVGNLEGVTDMDVEIIRRLCEESATLYPFLEPIEIAHQVGADDVLPGALPDKLYDELRAILPATRPSDVDTHDLRAIAHHFLYESAIETQLQDWHAVITSILRGIPAGTPLEPVGAPVWARAITIGRALVALGVFDTKDNRAAAVAGAARRLRKQGYQLAVTCGQLLFGPGELERATAMIQSYLDRLGPVLSLQLIFRALKEGKTEHYQMYLPGPTYTLNPRDPSIPFGLLINLAVRSPIPDRTTHDPVSEFGNAVLFARDVAAVIDVEPYNQFETLNVAPKRVEHLLRELAVYDHLFTLRQWPPDHAVFLLRAFFSGEPTQAMSDELGWTPEDALTLCEAVLHLANADPAVVTRNNLLRAGLGESMLDGMLHLFVHQRGLVNNGYTTPLSAEQSLTLMFKPLIEVATNEYLLPARSLAGPAFYEAVLQAMRSKNLQRPALVGDGTERAVIAVLKRADIAPALTAEKYKMATDAGECDTVLESADDIVFIECKAKPLTRLTMAGEPDSALWDFAGGVFAAHLQALRHERILRTKATITFQSGAKLIWNDRRITRLSVTLLDHGAIQDRILFANLYDTLLRSKITVDPNDPKHEQAATFDKALA